MMANVSGPDGRGNLRPYDAAGILPRGLRAKSFAVRRAAQDQHRAGDLHEAQKDLAATAPLLPG